MAWADKIIFLALIIYFKFSMTGLTTDFPRLIFPDLCQTLDIERPKNGVQLLPWLPAAPGHQQACCIQVSVLPSYLRLAFNQ